MAAIFNERFTAEIEGDFVVFLIGMRVNNFLAVRKWRPVALAMPKMINSLYNHPEKGFLGGESFFNRRTSCMVQYWTSFEDLEKFARNPSDVHLEAWKEFYKLMKGDEKAVGIWHETFLVKAGNFEAIYKNMPRFGLANAGNHVKVKPRTDRARQRIKNLEEGQSDVFIEQLNGGEQKDEAMEMVDKVA